MLGNGVAAIGEAMTDRVLARIDLLITVRIARQRTGSGRDVVE
jgi:hypothetical protein